jgi:hypothetical protein
MRERNAARTASSCGTRARRRAASHYRWRPGSSGRQRTGGRPAAGCPAVRRCPPGPRDSRRRWYRLRPWPPAPAPPAGVPPRRPGRPGPAWPAPGRKAKRAGAPVLGPAGHGQAVGEQPRRGVVIALAEPDLAQDVIHQGEGHLLLKPVVPAEVVVAQLPQQGLALVKEVAGAGVIAAACREVAQNDQDQRVHRHRHRQRLVVLPVQWQRLLQQLLPPGRITVADEDEAGLGQSQRVLAGRHVLAAGYEVVAQAGQLRGVAAQPPEPPGHLAQVHGPAPAAGRCPGARPSRSPAMRGCRRAGGGGGSPDAGRRGRRQPRISSGRSCETTPVRGRCGRLGRIEGPSIGGVGLQKRSSMSTRRVDRSGYGRGMRTELEPMRAVRTWRGSRLRGESRALGEGCRQSRGPARRHRPGGPIRRPLGHAWRRASEWPSPVRPACLCPAAGP